MSKKQKTLQIVGLAVSVVYAVAIVWVYEGEAGKRVTGKGEVVSREQ